MLVLFMQEKSAVALMINFHLKVFHKEKGRRKPTCMTTFYDVLSLPLFLLLVSSKPKKHAYCAY